MGTKSYWAGWAVALIIKSAFELPFIFLGLVMPITELLGITSVYAGILANFEGGLKLPATILFSISFALFAFLDLKATLLVPWTGGDRRNWPVGMEDWPSWQEEKENTLIQNHPPIFFRAHNYLWVGKRIKTQELSIIRQFLPFHEDRNILRNNC